MRILLEDTTSLIRHEIVYSRNGITNSSIYFCHYFSQMASERESTSSSQSTTDESTTQNDQKKEDKN